MAHLDEAIRELERVTAGIPPPSAAHGYAYAAALQQIGAADAISPVGGRGSGWGPAVTQFTVRWMPWEVERLRRAHAWSYRKQLAFWRELERHTQDWPDALDGQGYVPNVYGLVDSYDPFSRADLLQSILIDDIRPGSIANRMTNAAFMELAMVTYRRTAQLALEMHRWRVEHGSLPDSLEALARPGGIPVCAQGGHPILFVPRGAKSLPEPYTNLVPSKYANAMATMDLPPHLLPIDNAEYSIPLVYDPIGTTLEPDAEVY
jgi:hypothetical protein